MLFVACCEVPFGAVVTGAKGKAGTVDVFTEGKESVGLIVGGIKGVGAISEVPLATADVPLTLAIEGEKSKLSSKAESNLKSGAVSLATEAEPKASSKSLSVDKAAAGSKTVSMVGGTISSVGGSSGVCVKPVPTNGSSDPTGEVGLIDLAEYGERLRFGEE